MKRLAAVLFAAMIIAGVGLVLTPKDANSWDYLRFLYQWKAFYTGAGGGGGNPISYVACSTAYATDGSLTFNKPTGTQNGDLMVCFIAHDGATATFSSLPTGWTDYQYIQGSGHRGLVAHKITDDDDGATLSFSLTSAHCSGVLMTIRKSSGTWDVDEDYDEATFANTETDHILPTMSASDNSILLAGFVNDHYYTYSGPDGMTLVGDTIAGTADAASAVYYQLYTSAGATGTKTIVWGAADDGSAMGMIVDVVP